MYFNLLINGFKKNKWKSGILLMFVSFSVAVAVIVSILLTQLFTAISSMYEIANPPHFLQLHKGDFSQSDLDKFNASYDNLEHSQTVTLINISGDKIKISNEIGKQIYLSESRLGISFVKQNDIYDVLLDENRKPLELNKGEIAVPIILTSQFNIEIGDTLTLIDGEYVKTYKVSNYAYDGQMNSTMVSSTRFLVSDEDFEELLVSSSEKEYMIESWFSDSKEGSSYQSAYEQSEFNLPRNGQAVTYIMIFLLSAFKDILIAMIFSFAGILLVVVSLICLRYSVLADIEEDMREIGTMKAIGISKKGIINLYLMKIRIITILGSFIGLIIAISSSVFINQHISRTFGRQDFTLKSLLFSVLISVIMYVVVIIFSKRILGRLSKASVVDLLVSEKGFIKKSKKVNKIQHNINLPFDFLVSLQKVKRGYGIIFVLMLIITLLIMMPFRAVQTMENVEFVTYMGSPVYDLRIDVEQGESLESRNKKLYDILQEKMKNGEISYIDALRQVRLQGVSKENEIVGLHISTGDTAGRGLRYILGNAPTKEDEIVLSYLMSEELQKNIGDEVKIISNGGSNRFKVSGIYQDITSGGKTAKTIYSFSETESEKYSYGIMLSDVNKASEITNELRDKLGSGYVVENMEDFVGQTFGNVTNQAKKASIFIFLIGIFISSLIIALFIKLLLVRDGLSLAMKKTLGVPFVSIIKQEIYPIIIAGSIGSLIGVILVEIFGDKFISTLFSILGIGLKEFIFVDAKLWQLFVFPLILVAVLIFIGVCILVQIKKIDVMRYVNE